MLVHAVVIAGDGAGADVGLAADFGIADIAQVVRLRTRAEMRILDLDEIAHARAGAELGAAAYPRERPDDAGSVGDETVDVAMGVDHGSGGKARVGNAREGADRDFIAEFDVALEDDVDVDFDIAPDMDAAAHVEAHRIGKADPLRGEFGGAHALVEALQSRQLPGIVGAEDFLRVHAQAGFGRFALIIGLRVDVGQVVLVLGVVVGQIVDPHAQPARFGGEDAAIDPVDGALLGGAVLFLDDGAHAADTVADDAAITVRDFELGHQGAQRTSRHQQAFEGVAANQRYVAIQHEDARIVGYRGHREFHRMPGAALFGMFDPGHIRIGERGTHLVAAVAVDDMDGGRIQRARGFQHMPEHRATGQGHQHLRARGLHALALACGQNDDVQRSGRHQRELPGSDRQR